MGERFSAPVQPTLGPTQPPVQWVLAPSGGKERPGHDADPLSPSSAVWAVRPVQSLSACTVQLYLYSPYGPYGLYRPSVRVQYSYTSTPPKGRTACADPQCLYSTATPLLPLWAVQPVQRLSACTVQLYLYSPYGPYGLYRASVPVQGCTLILLSDLLFNAVLRKTLQL